MKPIVSSGDVSVWDAGTIISYESNPVRFELARDFIIILSFQQDPNDESMRFDFHHRSQSELEIICWNFNNPLGSGNITPIRLGELDGRDLYFNFRVSYLATPNNRTIHYTFYQGGVVNHG